MSALWSITISTNFIYTMAVGKGAKKAVKKAAKKSAKRV